MNITTYVILCQNRDKYRHTLDMAKGEAEAAANRSPRHIVPMSIRRRIGSLERRLDIIEARINKMDRE